MTNRKIVLALLVAAAMRLTVSAETLSQSNVDTRLLVALRASPAAVQAALPAPWRATPIPSGPSKDANVILVLADQHLVQDADGKPVGTGTNRFVVLAIPATNPPTGDNGPMMIAGFSGDPVGAPGAYKVYALGQIDHEKTVKTTTNASSAEKTWNVVDGSSRLTLRVQYRTAATARSRIDHKTYSAAEPTVFRIYRVDQGADVVRSVPAGVDRVQAYELKSNLRQFAKILDGAEQLVSITAIPWYVRQVFLP